MKYIIAFMLSMVAGAVLFIVALAIMVLLAVNSNAQDNGVGSYTNSDAGVESYYDGLRMQQEMREQRNADVDRANGEYVRSLEQRLGVLEQQKVVQSPNCLTLFKGRMAKC